MPEGEWRYFFNDKELPEGDKTFEMEFPMDEFPVFIKEGAIIPMDIKRDYTQIGNKDSEGYITILIYPATYKNFIFYHPDSENKTEISYDKSDSGLIIKLHGKKIQHILNIHSDIKPSSIELDGVILKGVDSWNYNSEKRKLIIKTKNYKNGNYVINY